MHREWKTALYDYVHQKNRSEVDLEPSLAAELVQDPFCAERIASRIRRLKRWYQDRGATPGRCETRARLVRHAEDEEGIEALLALRIRRDYETKSGRFTDERIEQERIRLIPGQQRWLIARIDPLVPERGNKTAADHAFVASAEKNPSHLSGTGPYLNLAVLERTPLPPRSRGYNRRKAVEYADRFWDRPNPAYLNFDVNCTNYVSQCIFAGGIPMHYTGRRETGWWYQGMSGNRERWSFSWAVAHSLEAYLRSNKSGPLTATSVQSPAELTIGDVIFYDWDGTGRYGHSTVVTGTGPDGMPLVNANTTSSYRRYWDYRDSYAWTEHTRYRFYHIHGK